MGMGYGWGTRLGWLFMIIFWSADYVGYCVSYQSDRGERWKKQSEEAPLDILKRKYAKGDVTGEDFEKMKDDFKSD
jgi:putative membrane protein